MIDGRINTYVNEPLHLRGMREDEPLHIPTPDEYFAATGRVLLSDDYYQYFENSPFSLRDGPPPVVVASFQWSGFNSDGLNNVPLSTYFNTKIITNDLPYNAWRIRGMYYGGYLSAFYTVPVDPVPVLTTLGDAGDAFNAVDGGWSLAYQGQSGIIQAVDGLFYNGGGVDLWFPIRFQIELGYGGRGGAIATASRIAGSWDWPAFSSGIGTDYKHYRGFNPNWACFNGYANAPNVIAFGGCPYTGAGGYTPPTEPPDV